MSNYNIYQITDSDLREAPLIDLGIKNGIGNTIPYHTAVSNEQIIKLGYCCEPCGVELPIFLERNGRYDAFYPSKNGMYEIQPEQWGEVGDLEEEKTASVIITGVRVPAGLDFVLDLAIMIN